MHEHHDTAHRRGPATAHTTTRTFEASGMDQILSTRMIEKHLAAPAQPAANA